MFILSQIQAPIQAFFRPGLWMPFFKGFHTTRQRWKMEISDAKVATQKIVDAIEKLEHLDCNKETYDVHEVCLEQYRARVFVWTQYCGWLDVIEVECKEHGDSTTLVEILAFSTGAVPTWIPLSFLLSCLTFPMPFYDWGAHNRRLALLQEIVDARTETIESNRAYCCCDC